MDNLCLLKLSKATIVD